MNTVDPLRQGQGRALSKFGEWDVNDPASADGFTVIFAKARDEKNGTTTSANSAPPASPRIEAASTQNDSYHQDTTLVIIILDKFLAAGREGTKGHSLQFKLASLVIELEEYLQLHIFCSPIVACVA
ncbi:hypothetical protein RND71_026395 [Anisodus tanguticus]|uniref:RIN4 pathogenic type III effector avirulence factor Avr cleavage site domain-containing protein n=1 Tax=Anisodus tanguticus TaxID=243964 RepID=A0AAE1RNH1_9SOLA|nr:hypothetical protein RND71_026395 [Anisodus tanguticus]